MGCCYCLGAWGPSLNDSTFQSLARRLPGCLAAWLAAMLACWLAGWLGLAWAWLDRLGGAWRGRGRPGWSGPCSDSGFLILVLRAMP